MAIFLTSAMLIKQNTKDDYFAKKFCQILFYEFTVESNLWHAN